MRFLSKSKVRNRNQGVSSCVPPRHDLMPCRLRCDRQETCSNCITRAISCTYTLNGQPRPSSSKTARRKVNAHTRPIERVRRLEELVASLASDRHASAKDSASSGGSVRSDADPFATSSADAYVEGEESRPGPRDQSPVAPLVDKLGRLEMNNGQMVYLSAAHWATICDEVSLNCNVPHQLLPPFCRSKVLWHLITDICCFPRSPRSRTPWETIPICQRKIKLAALEEDRWPLTGRF